MDFQPYYLPWTEAASCRSIGSDVFYPEIGEKTWLQARAVCRTCPVLDACRDWVMSTELGLEKKTRFGVTAAMSPLERHAFEPEWLAGQSESAA
jgi:hypothetical protein